MPTIIDCPSCNRQLRLPDDLLGRQVKCPTCGNTFTAATAGAPSPAPTGPGLVEEEPPARARPSPRQRGDEPDDDYDTDDDTDDDDRPGRRGRGRRRYLKPHRGDLILVLGILSIFVAQVILGPIAWVMANNDLKEMRAGRMDPDGEGNTNTGRICGIVGTVLGGIGLCCFGAWFLFVFGMIGASAHR